MCYGRVSLKIKILNLKLINFIVVFICNLLALPFLITTQATNAMLIINMTNGPLVKPWRYIRIPVFKIPKAEKMKTVLLTMSARTKI